MKNLARALFVLLAVTGIALADPIQIAGSTSGAFATAPPDLMFAGTVFNVVTDAAGNGTIPIGLFTLGGCHPWFGTCMDSYSHAFNLTVTFDLPTGIDGSPATYRADITGRVLKILWLFNINTVTLEFDEPSRVFTFADGNGRFTLDLPDEVALNLGENALTATIAGATLAVPQVPDAPEPASLLLLASALSGVGLLSRRRRRIV